MCLVQLGEVLPPLPVDPGACCGEPLPQGVLARPVQPRTCLLRLLPLLEQTAQLLALRPPLHPRRFRRGDRLGPFDDRGALRQCRSPCLLPFGADLPTAVLGVLLQLTEPSPQGVQVTDG